MHHLRKHLWSLVTLGAGLAAFVGMIAPTLWPLCILGVFGYLASSIQAPSWKHSLGRGFLFGVLASMGGVWWFWDTLPLTWLSVPEGLLQYLLVGIVYGLTVLSLALPFALAAPLVRAMPDAWYRPFLFMLLYVGIEELRMWSFALFFLAPESMLAPNFSVAGLGYVLTESQLLLPLAQGGYLALHATLALLAATFFERTRARVLLGVGVLTASFFIAHTTLPTEHASHTLRIGLISTQVPPGPFNDVSAVLAPMHEAASLDLDVIVTPEGLGLAPFLDADTRRTLYGTVFSARNGLVISSSVMREENGDEHAQLLYETPHEGSIGSQHKIFFVPVGEYLPPLIRAAISFASKETLDGYGAYIAGRAVPGSALTPATHDGTRVGALLCSELLSPRLYAALAATKTDLLLNLANNSWFNGSRLLHARLQQIAKTHALRNRQWFLVASNGSPSYAIDARGVIRAQSAWNAHEILVVEVPVRSLP